MSNSSRHLECQQQQRQHGQKVLPLLSMIAKTWWRSLPKSCFAVHLTKNFLRDDGGTLKVDVFEDEVISFSSPLIQFASIGLQSRFWFWQPDGWYSHIISGTGFERLILQVTFNFSGSPTTIMSLDLSITGETKTEEY